MKPFCKLTSAACPLPYANIDTDQIMPARFMRQPRSEGGYGRFLMHDLRRDSDGKLRSGFNLNDTRFSTAKILIARDNFGCGSSREPAVYALVDHGVSCVIAPSFGDIFSSNSVRNGLLPAQVSAEDAELLLNSEYVAQGQDIVVDLDAQTITAGNLKISFNIPEQWKVRLLNGWDDIDLTRAHGNAIDLFSENRARIAPWSIPRRV